MSSYKLVQFLKEKYVNPEGIYTPITIWSRTVRTWLNKLGFEYKNVQKSVFIDRHERPDVVEDRSNFLKKIVRDQLLTNRKVIKYVYVWWRTLEIDPRRLSILA